MSLNGQDYDAGDVHLVYHAQPAMLPLYGPGAGGTLLTINVSGVPSAAAAPAVAAAAASALCRFNASGQSVTTAATFAEASDTARCLTPPAAALSGEVLSEVNASAFETTVHLALNGVTLPSYHPTPTPPRPTPHAHAHAQT